MKNEHCDLATRKCVPCQGGEAPIRGERLAELLGKLDSDWQIVGQHHLLRTFAFRDFAGALAFVHRVGELAEREGHHPWIHFTWGKVTIELWTHKIGGLSENDFILAAKIDRMGG